MLHLTKDANTGPVRENSLLFEDETILLLGLFFDMFGTGANE